MRSIVLILSLFISGVALPALGQKLEDKYPFLCKEPFCTYAPPKLSGDEMASYSRAIIKSGQIQNNKDAEGRTSFLQDFIENKNFIFLTPYYVAATRAEVVDHKEISEACLNKTVEKDYLPKPNGLNSGPFYFYKVKLPSEKKEYTAAFVFGLDNNPSDDAVIAEFVVFNDPNKCDVLLQADISGTDVKKDKREFYPMFAGVGYYNNELMLYLLHENPKFNPEHERYKFTWFTGITKAKKFDFPAPTYFFQNKGNQVSVSAYDHAILNRKGNYK